MTTTSAGRQVDDTGHTDVTCDCYRSGCNFCDGGLWACDVCGGLEGSMPSKCPGKQMTNEQRDAVYRGCLDYRDTGWVEDTASRFCPRGLRAQIDGLNEALAGAETIIRKWPTATQ